MDCHAVAGESGATLATVTDIESIPIPTEDAKAKQEPIERPDREPRDAKAERGLALDRQRVGRRDTGIRTRHAAPIG